MKTWSQYLRPSLTAIDGQGARSDVRRGTRWLPAITVVPRQDCAFRRIRLQDRSRVAQNAARLEAVQTARFANPCALVVPDPEGNGAGVWTWSGGEDGARSPTLASRTLPESVARTAMDSGWRLCRCVSGVEGEWWEGGVLKASRWWLDKPSLGDWQLFVRGSGSADYPDAVPALQGGTWRDDLLPLDTSADTVRAAFNPGMLAQTALIALAALFLFRLGEVAHLQFILSRLETTIAANQEGIAATRQTRRETLRALSEAERFASMGQPEAVLFALADLAAAIPDEAGRFVNFRVFDGTLEARFQNLGNLNGPELVVALEQSPWLEGVSISSGNTGNELVIRVDSFGAES